MGVRRLLTGPVGPGSTFSVLSAAEAAARAGRSFALVLPTQAAREHARNELARRMGHCDPLQVYTFVGLARQVLGPLAPHLLSQRERDALLAHALAADPGEEGELALRFRGFRAGLLRVFAEVESNGLTAAALERHLRAARLEPPRVRRLLRTYRAYRARIRKGSASEADLLQRAAQAVSRGKERHPIPDLVLVDGFTDLTPRQIAFLDALALKASETLVTWPVADPQATTGAFAWPDRIQVQLVGNHGFERTERAADDDPRPPVLKQIATHLFPETAGCPPVPPLDDREGLRVVRAASRRDEVEYALARAREFVTADPTRRWTDVLVVVPDVRRYRATIEQVGRELGAPVRVRGPLSLATSPLVQGGLAFLRSAASFELGPLLQAAACPAFGLSPDEADRLRRAARRRGLPATGSPELWVSLANELGGPAARLLDQAMELGHALEQALVDDTDETGRIRTGLACAVARRTLERLLRSSGLVLDRAPTQEQIAQAAAEVAARRELLALLGDLERLTVPISMSQREGEDPAPVRLVSRIEEEVRATNFRPLDRRRDVLHVVDAREARAWEADLVFVLGLVEREFPRPAQDDLFLPEATRRALAGRRVRGKQHRLLLPTAEDRAAEELFLFYAAATRARRELWLLFPGFTPSGTPRPPSRFVDAVRSLLSEPAWEQAYLARTPGDLVSDEPELLLTEKALRRFAYRRVSAVSRATGPEAEKVALATALLRQLLSRPAELARASIALRRPWAVLPGPIGAAALERIYSASELETYATCPFRHFVRHLLKARPDDDLAQSGLDALRQGSVVHGALNRVYADGEAPAAALAEEFERGTRELDIGLEEDAFRQQAMEAIEAFVREDDPAFRSRTRLDPWAFELPFGPHTPHGALEIEAPELGGTIRLRGQIDRVDVRGDAGFVTDYKLGGREVDGNYLNGMHQGERLQIPVYLLALEQVFKLRPLGAGFAALGTRKRTGVVEPEVGAEWEGGLDERRVRLHRVPLKPTLRRTETHIKRIVAGIAQGFIEPLPKEQQDCARCDARDVCRTGPEEARRRARRGRSLPILLPRR